MESLATLMTLGAELTSSWEETISGRILADEQMGRTK